MNKSVFTAHKLNYLEILFLAIQFIPEKAHIFTAFTFKFNFVEIIISLIHIFSLTSIRTAIMQPTLRDVFVYFGRNHFYHTYIFVVSTSKINMRIFILFFYFFFLLTKLVVAVFTYELVC